MHGKRPRRKFTCSNACNKEWLTTVLKVVSTLLDKFKHRGPNGTHRRLVFEPLGPNVTEALQSMSPSPSSYTRAKMMPIQVLLVLHCLHSNQVAHGDLNYGNILSVLQPFSKEDAAELCRQPSENKISPAVKRRDGKEDKWSPKQLYLSHNH